MKEPMTTPPETPTPRTKAALFRAHQFNTWDATVNHVAEEMAKLERQLTVATAQLEEARRQNAALGDIAKTIIDAEKAAGEMLELAAARRDKERLDWLEKQPAKTALGKCPSGLWSFFCRDVDGVSVCEPGIGFSPREAIDAAMQKEKQ